MTRAPKTEAELEELLSRPTDRVARLMKSLDGDLVLLGAAGKIGVTLGMMAARAADAAGLRTKVYAVSRFSDPAAKAALEGAGAVAVSCDLLDRKAVSALPESRNVVFLAGRKFGTSGAKDLTWAANVLVPANVAEQYPGSRIVAFSTGCVYRFEKAGSGGSREEDEPEPLGEYAQSTLARERIFEHYSRTMETRVCLFRLNYAIDLRYGVLHDIARKVAAGEQVDLSAGHFNCIWQGDVNERALLCLDRCSSPPSVLNITGAETVSTRWAAEELGRRLGRTPRFEGAEGEEGPVYLSNASKSLALFGPPSVSLSEMLDMTADWVGSGGASLGKPTHFERTDGKY